MAVKPNSKKGVSIAAKREKALELRAQGLNFRAIGKEIGVTHTTAHKYVTDALEESRVKRSIMGDNLRELELHRLDEILLECGKIMRTSQKELTRLAASDRLIKTIEARSKLTGLALLNDSFNDDEEIDEAYL